MGRHNKRKKWYTGPSLRECLAAELVPIWDDEVVQPARKIRRITTRRFGDSQLHPLRPFGWTVGRILVAVPVGTVGVLLCLSVIGLPLGLPLMLWLGAWCTKPIRKHPSFNPNDDRNMDRIDEYELAYEQHVEGN